MFAARVWGLDLGRSAVKGVLLAPSADGVEILAAHVEPLEGPPPDPSQDPTRDGRIWKALHRFQQKHELHKLPVCVAIPAQNTLMRDLTVARVGGRKLDQMVRFEASNEIPFVLDEVVWDYALFDEEPADPVRKGLLPAGKRNVIQTYLRVFTQLEMGHVDLITTAPLALLNFVRLEMGHEGRALALDVGAENTNILAVHKGAFWIRNMLTGGNRITAMLEEEFDLDFAAAQRAKENIGRSKYAKQILAAVRPAVHDLVRDLKTNLTYLDRTSETESYESAFLMGGGARLPGVAEQLARTLRLEMEDLAELRNMTVSPEADVSFVRANIGLLAVAIGAGLSGLGRDVTGVTFVPKGEVRAARISRSRGLVFVAGLLLWAVMLTLWGFALESRRATATVLTDYRRLSMITKSQQREMDDALDLAEYGEPLQKLMDAGAGRRQMLQLLNDTVSVFAAASRSRAYKFRLVTFTCSDVLRAQAAPVEIRTDDDDELPEGDLPPVEPTVDEDAFPWVRGAIKGRIEIRRGGNPGDAYDQFKKGLLGPLTEKPSMVKVSGLAAFTKDSFTVTTTDADWSELAHKGDLIRALPNGRFALIDDVVSATELVLAEPYGERFVGPFIISGAQAHVDPEDLTFTIRFEVQREAALNVEEIAEPQG